MRLELSQYLSDVGNKSFTRKQSREFLAWAAKNGKYHKLSRLVRLLMDIPASAMPQEQHFSELKRLCSVLRAWAKIEALDLDAVVYAWG